MRKKDAKARQKGDHMEQRTMHFAKLGGALLVGIVCALLAFTVVAPNAWAGTSAPYKGLKSNSYGDSGYIYVRNFSTSDGFYIWTNSTYDKSQMKPKGLKGVTYNLKKNTLTLNKVNKPTYTISCYGMGTGFKVKVSGTCKIGSISGNAKWKYNSDAYYPNSLSISGKGTLIVNAKKYGSSAISINAENTSSKLTLAKGVAYKLYAFGTGNVINVSASKIKKNAKAIVIKGKAKKSLLKKSGTYKSLAYYKTVSVTDLDSYYTRDVYTIDGTPCYIYDDEDSYYEMEALKEVTVSGAKYYFDTGNTFEQYKTDSEGVEIPLPDPVRGKVLDDNDDYMTIVKKSGKTYLARANWNKETFNLTYREWLASKWYVYASAGTGKNAWGSTTYFIHGNKSNSVAAKLNLPKGYTGTVVEKAHTYYSHVVANNAVVIKK